jgi:hypothetical protein
LLTDRKFEVLKEGENMQAGVISNHVNPNIRVTGQGEAMHRKYKRLKLGGGQAYDCSVD